MKLSARNVALLGPSLIVLSFDGSVFQNAEKATGRRNLSKNACSPRGSSPPLPSRIER